MKWCFVLWLGLAVGCQPPPDSPRGSRPAVSLVRVQRVRPLLGAYVSVTLYATNREAGLAACGEAFSAFETADRLLSIHRDDSELARVNRSARSNGVFVSPELFQVLQAGQKIARKTGGAFDLTIQPLTGLWGFIWKEYRLPTGAELARVLPRVDHRNLKLDTATREVRFLRAGMGVDPGGIGKGYAVDRAMDRLRATGIQHALVRAGGDLRVIGRPPGESAWTVQIEDPEKAGKRASIQLREGAISTSGNYENFFEIDGVRYGHLIDPRTGLPIRDVASCSVTAPTCLESDALATAFSVLGVQQSLQDFGDEYGIRFVTLPDSPEKAGEVMVSPKFPAVLTEP